MAEKNTQLWSPGAAAVSNTELTRFTHWVSERLHTRFANFNELHRWSVEDPERFWSLYWEFAEIVAEHKGDRVVDDLSLFPGARWFTDARLNFAENLLQERSDKIALISILEDGTRREVSYADLYSETASVASWLTRHGIQAHDRIAGWLPNIPEAAAAMLASSSIGAVWSSCSPDFGAAGALDRFGQIEPRVLFACDGYQYGGKIIDIRDKVREVAGKVPSIETIVWVDVLGLTSENTSHEQTWDECLPEGSTAIEFAQLPFDHPLYILYSSGTTGAPKCIVHGQGGTLLQHKKEHQLHIDLRADDTLFFFTTCGWMMWNWLISALASRCTIVLFDGSPFHPHPGAMFDICDQEEVTIFGISAKFLSGAQKAGVTPKSSHRLDSMRTLISTGSPLTQEGYAYVYGDIKKDCHLISMSGGTDIISCFMLGNPNLPVYAGELQSPGLGMAVDIWDESGASLESGKGELVCTCSFPSCPIGFWNDPGDVKFREAYFDVHPNIWVHGDYAEKTSNGGYVIHGRSDAVLNPGGVRIGTAEIYRQVEHFDEVIDAVCVGQDVDGDVRVVLFVVLREDQQLDDELVGAIKLRIRNHASPRHTPALVIAVPDIPRTMSGKIAELAVRDSIHGRAVKNTSALANPDSLQVFRELTL